MLPERLQTLLGLALAAERATITVLGSQALGESVSRRYAPVSVRRVPELALGQPPKVLVLDALTDEARAQWRAALDVWGAHPSGLLALELTELHHTSWPLATDWDISRSGLRQLTVPDAYLLDYSVDVRIHDREAQVAVRRVEAWRGLFQEEPREVSWVGPRLLERSTGMAQPAGPEGLVQLLAVLEIAVAGRITAGSMTACAELAARQLAHASLVDELLADQHRVFAEELDAERSYRDLLVTDLHRRCQREASRTLRTLGLLDEALASQRAILGSRSWRVARQIRRLRLGRAQPNDRIQQSVVRTGAQRDQLVSDIDEGLDLPLARAAGQQLWPQGPAAGDVAPAGAPGFIQMSPIPWNSQLFQRPQHMASALARLGAQARYSTVFAGGLSREDVGVVGRAVEPGLLVQDIETTASADNSGFVVSFYSTDLTVSWQTLQSMRRRGNVLVYEYIDHIDPAISPGAAELEFRHKHLIGPGTVDYVVGSSAALVAELLARFPAERVLELPNGVDANFYRSASGAARGTSALPARLPRLRRGAAVLGYFGAIAPWLDSQLIAGVAAELPEVELVFIGPDYDSAGPPVLPTGLPNVHRAAAVPYRLLPSLASGFTAAWIPFAPGRIATTTSPLKLYEYFALGLPVVAPDWMPECHRNLPTFGGANAGALTQSVVAALAAAGDDHLRVHLLNAALANDWSARASTLWDVCARDGLWPQRLPQLEQRVGPPQLGQGRPTIAAVERPRAGVELAQA